MVGQLAQQPYTHRRRCAPQDTFSGVGIDLGEQYGSLFLGLFNACERLSKKSYLVVAHAPPWHDVACRPDTAMLSMRVQTCVMGSVLLQHLSPLQQRLHHSHEERGLPLAGYASETSEYSLHKESILWSHTLTVFGVRQAILARTKILRRDYADDMRRLQKPGGGTIVVQHDS